VTTISPTTIPNRVRIAQDMVHMNVPNLTVGLPEKQGWTNDRSATSMTHDGGQAYNLNDRVGARRRADDIARDAHEAQVRAIITRQGQQLLLATQAASASAIQLAEAKAATQLAGIHTRNAIHLAEANATRDAQLRCIHQIESQRTAMTPAANPSVHIASDPPPAGDNMTTEDPSVVCDAAQSTQVSFETSEVNKGVADSQISLNLSDSRSKGRAVECRSQMNGGPRCNSDVAVCDCEHYRLNTLWLDRQWQDRRDAILQKKLEYLGCPLALKAHQRGPQNTMKTSTMTLED
jgi:hypothetical protein